MLPCKSYLICATARCGSALHCESLKNTGLAGDPWEFFLWKDEVEYAAKWGVTARYPEYFYRALEAGSTPNGVFGGKIMWYGFPDLVNRLGLSLGLRPTAESLIPSPGPTRERARMTKRTLRHMPAYLGYKPVPVHEMLRSLLPDLHYIHIRRRDLVEQAISQWKLSHTRVAVVRAGEATPPPRRRPQFDFRAIDRLVGRIAANNEAWDRYFAEFGIEPFRVVYEDLIDSYEETARQALDFLGIEIPRNLSFQQRRMQKQADTVSMEWARQYREIRESRAFQRA